VPETLHPEVASSPLRELFKDECASLVPASWAAATDVFRPPVSPARAWAFAHPGRSAARIPDLLAAADAIFIEELHASGWYERTIHASRFFSAVAQRRLMGDGRTY